MNNAEALDNIGMQVKRILELNSKNKFIQRDIISLLVYISDIYINFLQRFIDSPESLCSLNDYYKSNPKELMFLNNLRMLCSKLYILQLDITDIFNMLKINNEQVRDVIMWLTFPPDGELVLTIV